MTQTQRNVLQESEPGAALICVTAGCQLAAIKRQNRAKCNDSKAHRPTEMPTFVNYLNWTVKTAKLLFLGSIPTRPQMFSTIYLQEVFSLAAIWPPTHR
jgi:hypothetical protein